MWTGICKWHQAATTVPYKIFVRARGFNALFCITKLSSMRLINCQMNLDQWERKAKGFYSKLLSRAPDSVVLLSFCILQYRTACFRSLSSWLFHCRRRSRHCQVHEKSFLMLYYHWILWDVRASCLAAIWSDARLADNLNSPESQNISPSHIHCSIPGSKLTFSTNLFHHS